MKTAKLTKKEQAKLNTQIQACKPKYAIHLADAVAWAKDYKGEPFHAIFCDAPYHLTTIVKRFGKKGSAPAKHGTDGVFSRSSKGFMGQTWDGGDIAFQPETWKAFMGVLHPGAFGMAFSASRNWHRMAVAIEDAGFIIHPTIWLWAQGQGFPKATKVRDERFDGHKYGLQALKPAVEPIIVFQKPYEGRPLDNILQTGAGTLNIDATRVGVGEEYIQINRFVDGAKPWGNAKGEQYKETKTNQGRYPSNLLLTEETAQMMDRQSGTSRFYHHVNEQLDLLDPVYYCAKVSPTERNAGLGNEHEPKKGSENYRPNDDGTKGIQSRLHGATVKGRNPHPTLKPIDLCTYLAKTLLPPVEYSPRRIFIPFAGTASEMIGAGRAGWDIIEGVEITKEYIPIAEQRLEHWLA